MFHINSFTDGYFSGGRAMVGILRHLTQEEMLAGLAQELNKPVTAFVLPYQDGFGVRYFSPSGELYSGGYAAMSAARAVYMAGLVPPDNPLTLNGRGGLVTVRPADGEGALSLTLAPAPTAEPPPDLESRLSLAPGDILGAFTLSGGKDLVVCLKDQRALGKVVPAVAAALAPGGGLAVLSLPLDDESYAVRCFHPGGEAEELPVNIGFHAALAPFWAVKLGRATLDIHLLSRRNAFLRAETARGRVELSGRQQLIYKAVPAVDEFIVP